MGTRHQIYIITQVLGHYRVVAIYHLHSLYPPEAVELAWTLLQHVKKHAGPFEKELRCLREGRYAKNDAPYPCPFLGAVLFQRVQDFYGRDEGTYPRNVAGNNPWIQNNNSGFTVIDVTNPFSPAYCFWGWNEDYGFPAGYPIDPEGYALRYCAELEEETVFEDLEQNAQDAILALQGERFIGSKHILDEAWNNWCPTLDEMDDEAPSQDAKEFMKALAAVIKAGSMENAQQVADALSSTFGMVEGLRRTLRRKRLPKYCDPVIVKGFLIAQDLSKSNELNLSWMRLSPAQVLKVVRAVLQVDSFKVFSLDISGNSDITVGTLSDIFKLRSARKIRRLYLFGCPKVEDVRRADMPGRIGMEEGAEVYNSYFPEDLSEFRPWARKLRSGKPRPRV